MAGSASDRLFDKIAELGVHRPWLVALLSLAVFAAGAVLSTRLTVSTSRTGLVSDDNVDQARLHRFFDRFGRPDAPIVLVSGGSADDQRAVVDRLQAAYELEPALAGRVLGRLRPRDIAEVLLLQQPDALAQLRKAVPPGQDLAALLESGVVGWIGAIADRLEASIADEADDDDGEGGIPAAIAPQAVAFAAPAPAGTSIDAAAAGLDALALLATALDDHLGGASPMDRFAGAASSLADRGIDERGYLVTGDGASHLVALYPALASDEGAE